MNNSLPTKPFLIIIAGPTAVGKTGTCVQLAKYFGCEVVSADSRQLYFEMQIGTARPTQNELEGVPHHFLGSHSIHQSYSVGEYERDVLTLLEKLFVKFKLVILTGGSGLYIDAVRQGLDELPPSNPSVRESLTKKWQMEGLAPLQEELRTLDPIYYTQVDLANPHRLIRALEVIQVTGKPFSSFRRNSPIQRPFQAVHIVLNRDREELYQRIDRRMDLMLENGLVDEAKKLYQFREHSALKTVGYQEIFDFWSGKQDWRETVRLLKRNSRRYAKRQLTWFRRNPLYRWLHPDDFSGIAGHIEKEIDRLP